MRTMLPMTLAEMDAAPFRFTATGTVPCEAARLFEELGDPALWPKWFPLMRTARWTSPETACAGARREVAILGFGRFEETILAFEPGERFAFTMIASTSPLAHRMAEDYRITATTGGARLDWTLAAVPTAVGRVATTVLPSVLRGIWAGALKNLRRRVDGARG